MYMYVPNRLALEVAVSDISSASLERLVVRGRSAERDIRSSEVSLVMAEMMACVCESECVRVSVCECVSV